MIEIIIYVVLLVIIFALILKIKYIKSDYRYNVNILNRDICLYKREMYSQMILNDELKNRLFLMESGQDGVYEK